MPITPNPDADFTPDRLAYSGQGEFRFWCQTVLPLVYDDSLSYYELLNKVVNYLNSVIRDVGFMGTNVTNLFNAYTQLENYVNNYFHSLDVQEEIDNKLDEMAESGALNVLINPVITASVSDWLENNLTPTEPPVDSTLSVAEAAADAGATGAAIYGSKNRSYNKAGQLTYWDITAEGYTTSNKATPSDIPINSYTEALGEILDFGSNVSLSDNIVYYIQSWKILHGANPAICWYLIIGRDKKIYAGRSLSNGESVTWISLADTDLSKHDTAAESYAVGMAIYRGKDRATNDPAAFTYWDITDAGFSSENPASPSDMPVNSYTEAVGASVANFNENLNSASLYLIWCWSIYHNANLRYYIIWCRTTQEFRVGRTANGGTTVDWTNWTPDTTLTNTNAPAEANTVGRGLYDKKSRTDGLNIPAGLTFWNISQSFSAENPASPSDMPPNSYTYTLGSLLDGFRNDTVVLSDGVGYFVYCFSNMYQSNRQTRMYLIIRPASYSNALFIGRSTNSGSTVSWAKWSTPRPKQSKIFFLGDSITRGRIGGQTANATTPIPTGVANELDIVCRNGGIGDIGWCGRVAGLTYSSYKDNGLAYLKRVQFADYYDSSSPYNGWKFMFSYQGGWDDTNAIVIALGANDGSYALGDINDLPTYDAMSYSDVMAWNMGVNGSDKTILKAMYQMYRYIRESEIQYNNGVYTYVNENTYVINESERSTPVYVKGGSVMPIIICDPLPNTNGTAPYWSYITNRAAGYTLNQLCDMYASFCERYGLGHITTKDAPLDRVNLNNCMGDGTAQDRVHPHDNTYNQLGRYFAGKISALLL